MISGFFGPYRFLSNFYPAEVELDGEMYPSTEYAYQAAKTVDLAERMVIRMAPKPRDAKHLGKTVRMRANWQPKVVMEQLVEQKFTRHADLREKLLATGDEELIEENTWGDTDWGVCGGVGWNHLGQILMRVRGRLRGEL